jgi:outer membrane protein TolC
MRFPFAPAIAGLALAGAAAARAQPAPTVPPAPPSVAPAPRRSLDLAEALAYAAAHEPRIRSALAQWRARRAEARVPRAAWFPQIGGTAQLVVGSTNNTTASYGGVPEVDLVRIGATRSQTGTDWSPSASTLAAISVDQQVYDFGRIAAQAAVADALAEAAHQSAFDVALQAQLGVEEAYHAVLAAKEVIGATEDAYKRALTHRDYAKAGVKSGLRPPIDLTRAQADVAQLEVRRIRALSGLDAARAALAASIGADEPTVDARPAPEGETPMPAFAEALKVAGERNPEVARAVAKLRAQEAETRAVTRELAPNVFATAGLSGRAGGAAPTSGGVPYGEGWLPDVGNWHAGLVLQWNAFDAMVLARRSASQAREEVARADVDLARTQVALEAERAYLDLDAASRALPGLAAALDAARANQAQAEARFKAGLGTIVELADAEALLTSAQLELAIGQFGVARARAALARALGQHRIPRSANRP